MGSTYCGSYLTNFILILCLAMKNEEATCGRKEFAEMMNREVSNIKPMLERFPRIAPQPLKTSYKQIFLLREVKEFLANKEVQEYLAKHEIRRTCRLNNSYNISGFNQQIPEGVPVDHENESIKIGHLFLSMPIYRWGKKIINEVEHG